MILTLSRIKRPPLIAAIIGFIVIASAAVGVLAPSAFASVWDGRGAAKVAGAGGLGYFTRATGCLGTTPTCDVHAVNNYVLPQSTGGVAIPTNIDTPAEFISFLKIANADGGTSESSLRRKSGSAFIIHSLLGRSGDEANQNGGLTISAADFGTVQSRLNALELTHRIAWKKVAYCSSPSTLTMYVNGKSDIVRNTASLCDTAIVMTNNNGTIYALMRTSGSPVGTMSPLQFFQYNLTPVIDGTPHDIDGSYNNVILTPIVNNNGGTVPDDIDYQVTTFKLDPGVAVPTGSTGSGEPADFYKPNDSFTKDIKLDKIAKAKFGSSVNLKDQMLPQSIADYPVGTRICYGLSVKAYAYGTADWRYSQPFCITVTKKPKIQIWGGDVLVGRAFSGQSAPSSFIQTSVTTQAQKTETVPAPASAFGGLWNTGVAAQKDKNGNQVKLAANVSDPHWNLGIVRPTSDGIATCQKGQNSSGAIVDVPASITSSFPARTVYEQGSPARAGYAVKAPNSIIGNITPGGVNDQAGTSPWAATSSNARWISQNYFGQNYSNSNCKDPTYPPNEKNIERSNIYAFWLKDGFTIDPDANVDLGSVVLNIKGAADNGVRFYVNGHYVDNGWQYPGYTDPNGRASSVAAGPGIFKNGVNTLQIFVLSNYSASGLMINDLTITGTSQKKLANQYGSWGEYAVGATNQVKGLASAAAYAGGIVATTECATGLLTLANTAATSPSSCNSASDLGNFNTGHSIPDISTRFPTSSGTPKLSGIVDLGGSNKQGLYTIQGATTLNLSATTLKKGQWVVINAPEATVTITGDIKYANGPFGSLSDIPQLVIIANRIDIRSNVGRVDAWLVAKGSQGILNTCHGARDASDTVDLSSSICNTLLTVNGPVMAKHIYLRRTLGASQGTSAGEPAEVFNLRPDAYFWAVQRAATNGRVQTVYTQELPPRF